MRILIASQIDADAVERLASQHEIIIADSPSGDELQRLMRDREVLIFRSGVNVSRTLLDSAPELRLIVRAGCGLDNIDVDAVGERGITLLRVPQPAAKAVSELAIALMLTIARNVQEADRQWRRGHWVKESIEGHLLYGKVLGIVGVGNIGSRLAELGNALGMRVIGCVEHPSAKRRAELLLRGVLLSSFDDVMARSDFVSIHVQLQSSTRNLISQTALSRMKPGSFLVNLARGGVVDEQALLCELRDGERIRAAGLDVHACEGEGKISPLADLPNVILTPHIGANTVDTQREIGSIVVSMIAEFSARTETSLVVTAAAEAA